MDGKMNSWNNTFKCDVFNVELSQFPARCTCVFIKNSIQIVQVECTRWIHENIIVDYDTAIAVESHTKPITFISLVIFY